MVAARQAAKWSAPTGIFPSRGCRWFAPTTKTSRQETCIRQERPVSRILLWAAPFAWRGLHAVIPLDAASPRTFISDLPGGFGNGSSRLSASGRCATQTWLLVHASLPIWSCSVWGLPCLRLYSRSGALLPHHFTLTPALTQQAVSGSPSRKRGSRGGIFSVALAVHEFLSPWPGRYPAHCPAEFGLSSPGCPVSQASGSDRPVLLPALVYPNCNSSLPLRMAAH